MPEDLLYDLAQESRSRYFGKYRGIVRDVDDPLKLGRITARVPSVYGDQDSPWALPAVPFAGAAHGLVLLPEVDDGVWIEFEAGDISRPIWTGFWWASDEIPAPQGKKARRLVTPKGLTLSLDDDENTVTLGHPGGAKITLTQTGITLEFSSAKLELTASGVSVNSGALEVR
jgi:Type VI secretion system/phage-baseplate injector OB domain